MAKARVGNAWFLRSDWSHVSHDQSTASQLKGKAQLGSDRADLKLIR